MQQVSEEDVDDQWERHNPSKLTEEEAILFLKEVKEMIFEDELAMLQRGDKREDGGSVKQLIAAVKR